MAVPRQSHTGRVLEQILEVLTDAVCGGAVHVLAARRSGDVGIRYKSGKELVTAADEASDVAIRAVFESRLPALVPGVAFQLEESSPDLPTARCRVGADPIDGTSHFAAGGHFYSIQAHYVEDGLPLIGVVLQPEAFLPLDEAPRCLGRLVYATRSGGAWVRRTEFAGDSFVLSEARRVEKRRRLPTSDYVACVPMSVKMTGAERARAQRVHDSGVIAVTTGVGGAGGNVMMTIFGGQDVYANFGAGNDLDLIPPQVIAEEAGLTVWGADRHPPVWNVRKQPFIVAPDPAAAEVFLRAAGL